MAPFFLRSHAWRIALNSSSLQREFNVDGIKRKYDSRLLQGAIRWRPSVL
jgi:hypothetical protein